MCVDLRRPMRERYSIRLEQAGIMNTMRKTSLVIIVLLGAAVFDGRATPAATGERAQAAEASDLSAQTRRVRPRVRIYRQPSAWPYPRPGYYSWPGPNAVRRCVDWYAMEYRPSGTVITPQMRCWWVSG
jgi:hypothetical protein